MSVSRTRRSERRYRRLCLLCGNMITPALHIYLNYHLANSK